MGLWRPRRSRPDLLLKPSSRRIHVSSCLRIIEVVSLPVTTSTILPQSCSCSAKIRVWSLIRTQLTAKTPNLAAAARTRTMAASTLTGSTFRAQMFLWLISALQSISSRTTLQRARSWISSGAAQWCGCNDLFGIDECKQLKSLFVGYAVNLSNYHQLSKLECLQNLALVGCGLSDEVWHYLDKLASLEILDLSQNHLASIS